MTIGDNIKRLRNFKNITQKELAERLGTSQQNLAQYENGKRNPKLETLQKIAKALEVTIEELLTVDVNGIPSLNMMDIPVDDMGNFLNAVRAEQKNVEFQQKEALLQGKDPQTIAAHFAGDDFTPEELEEIIQFAEFVKNRKKNS